MAILRDVDDVVNLVDIVLENVLGLIGVRVSRRCNSVLLASAKAAHDWVSDSATPPHLLSRSGIVAFRRRHMASKILW